MAGAEREREREGGGGEKAQEVDYRINYMKFT